MAMKVPEEYRLRTHPLLGSDESFGRNGCFIVPSPEPGWSIQVIASDGLDCGIPEAEGWEHVSVHAFRSGKDRTPNWREMCFIKDLFWDDEDVVMQLHPRKSQYVNVHQHTLHLWRPRHLNVPEPAALMVG